MCQGLIASASWPILAWALHSQLQLAHYQLTPQPTVCIEISIHFPSHFYWFLHRLLNSPWHWQTGSLQARSLLWPWKHFHYPFYLCLRPPSNLFWFKWKATVLSLPTPSTAHGSSGKGLFIFIMIWVQDVSIFWLGIEYWSWHPQWKLTMMSISPKVPQHHLIQRHTVNWTPQAQCLQHHCQCWLAWSMILLSLSNIKYNGNSTGLLIRKPRSCIWQVVLMQKVFTFEVPSI